jgi:hypothetical protein
VIKIIGFKSGDDRMSKPLVLKIYFDAAESGWVEVLPERGQFRIANIPNSGPFNLDDIIETSIDSRESFLEKLEAAPFPAKIIERPFPVRTFITYQSVQDFRDFVRFMQERGGKVEGFMGPGDNRPGYAGVAAKSEGDVLWAIRQVELPQERGWKANTL